MIVIETERLMLRHLEITDAVFLHALLTDADFIANIGDRGVKTVEDAERVIPERYQASYARDGFGMFAVEAKASGVPLGLAGLVDRPGLDHVDLGYAFMPAARGQGYAIEAARGVVDWADARGITPLLAIVSDHNRPSVSLLSKLNFLPTGDVVLPGEETPILLFRRD